MSSAAEHPIVSWLAVFVVLRLFICALAYPDYTGVTISLLTYNDSSNIADCLLRHGQEFEALTGATVTIGSVSFFSLYSAIQVSLMCGFAYKRC